MLDQEQRTGRVLREPTVHCPKSERHAVVPQIAPPLTVESATVRRVAEQWGKTRGYRQSLDTRMPTRAGRSAIGGRLAMSAIEAGSNRRKAMKIPDATTKRVQAPWHWATDLTLQTGSGGVPTGDSHRIPTMLSDARWLRPLCRG
jgi:hypothetical protein